METDADYNWQGVFSSQRVIGTWNKLAAGVVEASSVNSFKRRLEDCSQDVEATFTYTITRYTLHVTDTAKWRRWVAGGQRRARLSWRCPLLHAAAAVRCETCSQVQSASDNTSSNSIHSQCFDAVGWVRHEGHPACKKSCTSHPFPDVLLLDLRGGEIRPNLE